MKLTVHRGTKQIGGCVVEIESSGYKIFIDYGEQLPGTETTENILPPIEGLTTGEISKSALFITHYHGDHIGAICDTVPALPIYAGKTAIEIYKCLETRLSYIPDQVISDKHKNILERIKTIITFEPLQKVKVGGITVTPLFIDHSAFDAYMFIVEADGKRVLHTGDFRGHGFKSKALVPMLQKYCTDIDYIISEGSNILRPDAAFQTEQKLQKDFEAQFHKNKYNFVFVSSTNIDRILSLYHVAKKARRCFVCDAYQTSLLKIVSNLHKQYTPFYDIDFEQSNNPSGRYFELKRKNGYPFEFNENLKLYLDKNGFCMIIRANDSFAPLLLEYSNNPETKIYYSMWTGYLNRANPAFNPAISDFFKPFELVFKHTSGHSDIKTLGTLFETVNPKSGIIPIHTEAPDMFKELFPGQNVLLLQDGTSFDCP
ncbi:MAG: MBL fold metallo-hydrolase [Treponema sp.]|jgi:ribonuclease J|nr:MBL fold metallo-hydrolase [Treponema sp.]